MGDKRREDYIKLGALYGADWPNFSGIPRPDPTCGPVFVSHEESLRRAVEIVNARIVAELGPLPPGGLPVVKKQRIDAQGRPKPPLTEATREEEAMKWIEATAAAAMAAGVAACEPQAGAEAAEQAQATALADKKAVSVSQEAQAAPKEVAAVPERAPADVTPAVPDEIRAFVPEGSTLLAYKRFDLTGDGQEDAVLIVRHPVIETYADFSKNPCDLIVLHGEGMGFRLAAKSSKVVDCTYKLYAREIANRPDELNDYLELGLEQIVSEEETDKPTGVSTTYAFRYSSKKDSWHLSYARAAFARSERIAEEGEVLEDEWELNVYTQVVRYPEDIPFIPLSRFDPDDELLLRAMVKNQKKPD